MKVQLLIASLLVSGLSGNAFAEDAKNQEASVRREKVIDQREANQQKRIEEGEKNGSLTKGETKRLENEQNRIKKMEVKAEGDGKVTKKEMERIEKAQNHASKDIEKKKHNKRKQ